MALTITCNKDILKLGPCLQCLSYQELLGVLVYVLSIQAGYSLPNDTNRLMRDSACIACLTDKDLLISLITSFAAPVFSSSTTTAQVRNATKCLLCANPQQLKAAIAFLVCKLEGGA